MTAELVMPQLSDSMEEGTISRWLKQVGDRVAKGEPIVEIETDKATITHEAEAEGVLREILVPEGGSAPLGQPIGLLGEPGAAAEKRTNGDGGRRARPPASPVARRLAQELGLDLVSIAGSGPNGRIVKADVLAAAPADGAPAAPSGASPPTPVPDGSTYEELTRVQRLVARRMAESKATVPDFTLFVDVEMDACLDLRGRLKQLDPATPSVNDMVVKAAALALREHPRANASYRGERFELHPRVNVGVAVASDEGLVVPVVCDADAKSLGAIAAETRVLAAAVREGRVTAPQLSGGTFTVSNLGMFGVDAFTAIVNPPQAAILSVGAIRRRPVARDDRSVAVAEVMTLGLISDHRILNGADAARFLARIRELLEEPLAMLL